MSYPDPEYVDPARRWCFCALIAILLASLFLYGCNKPAKSPCCPGACPKKPAVSVVWFHAEWCAPCKGQAPEAKAALAGYNWRKIDIDQRPELARHYKIRAVPTYVVLVDGIERSRTNSAKELRRLLGR